MKSEAGHTPGPWAVHLGFAIDDGSVEPMGIYTDDGQGNGLPIAFRDDDARAGEARANAKLIEAAPSMFEALRLIALNAEDGLHLYTPGSMQAIARTALSKVQPS